MKPAYGKIEKWKEHTNDPQNYDPSLQKSKTMIPKAPKKLNSTHYVMQRYKCLHLFTTTIMRMEKVSSLML